MLGLIGGIGATGHRFHWSIPGLGSHGEKAHRGNDHFANSLTDTPVAVAEKVATTAGTDRSQRETNDVHRIVFQSPEAITNAGIQLEKADFVELSHEIVSSAQVEYDRRHTVDLSSRVSGTIFRVTCQAGQFVKAGDVLAIVEAGEVGRLKSEFAKAIFDRNLKQKTLDRYRLASDALPLKLVIEAEGALQVMNVAVLSAEQALVNLGFNISLVDYQGLSEDEVIQRLRTLGLEDDSLKSITSTSKSSNLLPIRSPIDGFVIGHDMAVGEAVNSERAFMQVSDVSRVWIKLDIHKEDAAAIRVGQRVQFEPDGSPAQVEGTVSWVSTEVDEKTRTLSVRAEVKNPKLLENQSANLDMYLLRANMFGTAKVRIRQENAVAVSRECVHLDDGHTMVFVQTGHDTFESRTVTCGIAQDGMVELIGEIAPGSMIASRGSQMLKSELVLAKLAGGAN